MYGPRSWDLLAQWLVAKSQLINSSSPNPVQTRAVQDLEERLTVMLAQSGPDIRRTGMIFSRDDADDTPPDYSFQAITCSDAPDANYTTKDVFDELVRVTREVSQVFGPQWGDVSFI